MNSNQAKEIPLRELLSRLGVVEKQGQNKSDEIWYFSPFRDESTPSFHIKVRDNTWFDFSEWKGGNILDFVMRYKDCDFRSALAFLDNMFSMFGPVTKIDKTQKIVEEKRDYEYKVVATKDVIHPALVEYILSRKISLDVAVSFQREVHYVNSKGKFFFGLGILNHKGGYEVRNKIYKSCVGEKSFTFLKGSTSVKLDIFEGMFDFLSKCTLKNIKKVPEHDTVILHTLSMAHEFINFANSNLLEYKIVHVFGHNDLSTAGLALIKMFESNPYPIRVEEAKLHHTFYAPFKDLNDWLCSDR